MNRVILLFLGCLMLTSCVGSKSQVDEGIGKDNTLLITEYEDEIDRLKNENSELMEQLTNALIESNDTPIDEVLVEDPDSEDLIIIDEYKLRISREGNLYLEDGVILILELLDSNNVKWMKVWNNIDVTELAIISEPIIYNEEVYIVVDGNLNILNANDGEVRKIVNDVGNSNSTPVISEDGVIFTIGQYEPYVTSIDSNGNILWQIKDEAFTHAWKHELINGELVVEVMSGTYTINKDGTILSFVED